MTAAQSGARRGGGGSGVGREEKRSSPYNKHAGGWAGGREGGPYRGGVGGVGRQSAEGCRWMMESTGTARRRQPAISHDTCPPPFVSPGTSQSVCTPSSSLLLFFPFFLPPRWNVHEGFALCAKRPRPPQTLFTPTSPAGKQCNGNI